jgi:hypothetical protein
MDAGAGIALIIFCGIFVLFFPWKTEKPQPKPEKPETFVEIPNQQAGYPGGYPMPYMPYPPMSPPSITPVSNHQAGNNEVVRIGNRFFIKQLPPGTGNGGDHNG